jgi:type II secretory pathway pseudopilin PulG
MSPSRPAKTLLEVVVVISILTLVMSLSVTSLATLFRIHRQFRQDNDQAAEMDRLATRLRLDAHEAVSATLDDDCVLTLVDGRTVHYAYDMPRLTRDVRTGSQTLHHDRFRLPKAASVTFERDKNVSGTLIRVSIRPGEVLPRTLQLPRAATIEAAVGLHNHLAQNAREP